MLAVFATIPLLIWAYLLFGRGGFWRLSNAFRPDGLQPAAGKCVVAVVPARNEAETIGQVIAALLQQEIEPPLRVVMVDDASTDGTAGAATAAAERLNAHERLTVLAARPLEPGWTGKLWALAEGVSFAETLAPDYLLFTDADIVHATKSVAGLVAIAEAYRCELASYMVRLANETFPEKALIPAFVFFFLMLYPPAWTANPTSKTAGAAGGCLLIRPEALRRIGGIRTISGEIIDDCALARAVKRMGGQIWMGLTEEACSIRSYGGFGAIGHMVSRTAFNQLRHSTALLLATVLGLLITYVLPIALLFSGRLVPVLLGSSAWLLMSMAYVPMVRFYRRSLFWSFGLPAIAVFYAGATIRSATNYWLGDGGEWKGRAQDLKK